jgi:hypothetical protein
VSNTLAAVSPCQILTVNPGDDGSGEIRCRGRVGVGLYKDGLKDFLSGVDAIVRVVVGEGVKCDGTWIFCETRFCC